MTPHGPWQTRAVIAELSPGEIDALLREQVVGRIGCHAGGLTYVVPVIYAFADGAVHVATIEGQKTRMMRENPRVCFEIDEYERGSWRSVIAYGSFEELEGEEAEGALALLAERFSRPSGSGPPRRPSGSGRPTVVFRIRLEETTGRTVAR
jgi:uncharacterized protein